MSPRRNRDSPTPSPASECALPRNQRGRGALSPAGEEGGDRASRMMSIY